MIVLRACVRIYVFGLIFWRVYLGGYLGNNVCIYYNMIQGNGDNAEVPVVETGSTNVQEKLGNNENGNGNGIVDATGIPELPDDVEDYMVVFGDNCELTNGFTTYTNDDITFLCEKNYIGNSKLGAIVSAATKKIISLDKLRQVPGYELNLDRKTNKYVFNKTEEKTERPQIKQIYNWRGEKTDAIITYDNKYNTASPLYYLRESDFQDRDVSSGSGYICRKDLLEKGWVNKRPDEIQNTITNDVRRKYLNQMIKYLNENKSKQSNYEYNDYRSHSNAVPMHMGGKRSKRSKKRPNRKRKSTKRRRGTRKRANKKR